MRVAIPESDGRVERIFDGATTLMVIDIRGGGRGEFFETPIGIRSMKDRARELSAMGVDVLLCNEISHALESLIAARGIEVYTRHSGRVNEVVEAFIDRRREEKPPRGYRPPTPVTVS